MAKITPIYQFYAHELGDILYASNDENNMSTADKQIGGLYSYIGQGVRTGWEVTKLTTDPSYSSSLNLTIRQEQLDLIDGYNSDPDSYSGRRIISMSMQPIANCAAASTGNLIATYNSISKTLTNNSGTFSALELDGIEIDNNQYVLIKDQSSDIQNGVYIVTNKGSISQNWVLTRYSGLDTQVEIINAHSGKYCYWVSQGNENAKTIWTIDILNTDENPFVFNTSNINFEDAFQQCVRVTPGDGIVGLYQAITEEPVYFRYVSSNIYYIWATASPCLASEGKCLIVSPQDPDYNYDSFHVATYIGSVQVSEKGGTNNFYFVDYIEYDDRRNILLNLEGALLAALRTSFYKHVHIGDSSNLNNPKKINLSTTLTVYAEGPIGSTIFRTYILTESGQVQYFSWNANDYGFPEVRLNNELLSESSYNLQPTQGRIYLKNSLTDNAVIQITLPLSPQKKLYPVQGTILSANPILLWDRVNQGVFTWDDSEYLPATVYIDGNIISDALYTIVPNEGKIEFDPVRSSSEELVVLIEKVGKEITNTLSSARLGDIDASLFTKNELNIKRIAPLNHVGLVRFLNPALLNPTKRLFSFGDEIKYLPEDTTQDLQFTTDILKIGTSINNPGVYYFGTKRGLYSGNSLSNINLNLSWNPDNGEIIDIIDNVMRSSKISSGATSNFFNEIYVLTKEGRVFKSRDNGETWQKLKMPLIGILSSEVKATCFLASTQIEEYYDDPAQRIKKFRYSTLLYLGTNYGLFIADIASGSSDSDWAWAQASGWPEPNPDSYPTGDGVNTKEIYSIAEVVTQRTFRSESVDQTSYDRTIYVGSYKGFSVHGSTASYSSTKLISSEKAKGILWVRGVSNDSNSSNSILWFTDEKIFISHTARKIITETTDSYSEEWQHPLSTFSTSTYSNVNKIECDVLINTNISSYSSGTFTSPPSDVDGITLILGDRILVRGQNNPVQNGIYELNLSGDWQRVSFTASNWVSITNGNNWARSAWSFRFSEVDSPNTPNLNIGSDLLFFDELYINPVYDAGSQFIHATERLTSTSLTYQYSISSTENVWLITDRYIPEYNWNYPLVYKGNWNSTSQSNINATFYDVANPSNLYVASKQGLFYSQAPDSLLTDVLQNDLSVSDSELFVRNPSRFIDYNYVLVIYNELSELIEINVTPSGQTYTIEILSPAVRNNAFIAGSVVVAVDDEFRNVTNIIWQRTQSPLSALVAPNIYKEQELQISSDGSMLEGLISESSYTIDTNLQIVEFETSRNLGDSFIYENDFSKYYLDPWDIDSEVVVYINGQVSTKPFTLDSANGIVDFGASPNNRTDDVKLTIVKLNKYLKNTGTTAHAESSFLVRDQALTPLAQQLLPTDTQLIVATPLSIPLTTTQIELAYRINGIDLSERLSIKVQERTTENSNITREIFILSDRSNIQYTVPQDAIVFSLINANLPGIEDKISLAQSNQTYHMNSLGGANLSQLSLAARSAVDSFDEIKFPNLFTNFTTAPKPVYEEQTKRGPINSLFYDFSLNSFDTKNSSSNLFVGIVPSENNSGIPPTSFYHIYNPTYSGNNLRIGTNNGIWVYNSSSVIWSKETDLNNSTKVYFIKSDFENSNYLMAGTDTGLYQQQSNGTWELNLLYPQVIYDYISGPWEEIYDFYAFGKSDGISFVRINRNTGEFLSDHFEALGDKNVYGLYKQKFFRFNDQGQQITVDAIYLCTNAGLYGLVTGARGGLYSGFLTGREMFGDNPNRITITLPDGNQDNVSVKYYKIFNSPRPTKNNQPPVPIIILSNNGVYTVINWRWCDPATTERDFIVANHNLVGLSCTCFATATETITEDQILYKIYVGTNQGVYRSYDDARTFERCERINGKDLTINDIKSLGAKCLLVATDDGLWYSNDEGDTWYRTDENPDEGEACVSFRSSIDGGEYFLNGYLAQTFIPETSTINKVSLYLSREAVNDSNAGALDNVLKIAVYPTISGLPNIGAGPLPLTNSTNMVIKYYEGYRESDLGLYQETKKFSDNLENDIKTFEYNLNSSGSGDQFAAISALYDMNTNVNIDKIIAQVYYTQNSTLLLEFYDGNSSSWVSLYNFAMPIHGGSGKWEDVVWELRKLQSPQNVKVLVVGTAGSTTYSYKVTALNNLGETLATTVSIANGNAVLSSLTNYNRISWQPVEGAFYYRVYGRSTGSEKLIAEVYTDLFYNDIGITPGVIDPPIINDTDNLGLHELYRLSIKDDIDDNIDPARVREARIGDFRLYNDNVQYNIPDKITAAEIESPGFKSFTINITGLSTSATYALVARELNADETDDAEIPIIKWVRTNI